MRSIIPLVLCCAVLAILAIADENTPTNVDAGLDHENPEYLAKEEMRRMDSNKDGFATNEEIAAYFREVLPRWPRPR